MWTPPGYAQTVLPGLECDYCDRLNIALNGVNNAGTAVGSSLSSVYVNGQEVSGGSFAVEWQDGGSATSLGSLQDSGASAAYGINDSGDVVGSSVVGQSSGAPSHAFLHTHGTMSDLGTLSGDTNSSAGSINDSGLIVGSSDDGTTTRAFLYEDGQMYDLNSLIDPSDPLAGLVSLENAVGISSNGYIAVNGTDSRDSGENAGALRAFLLVPSH
jgi:probable HAF family extracellular repeat protein